MKLRYLLRDNRGEMYIKACIVIMILVSIFSIFFYYAMTVIQAKEQRKITIQTLDAYIQSLSTNDGDNALFDSIKMGNNTISEIYKEALWEEICRAESLTEINGEFVSIIKDGEYRYKISVDPQNFISLEQGNQIKVTYYLAVPLKVLGRTIWIDNIEVTSSTSLNSKFDSTATETGMYIVNHFKMDAKGSYPIRASETQVLRGGIGTSLTLKNLAKSYSGLAYSHGQVNGTTVTTTTVAANNATVINLFYKLTSRYDDEWPITWNMAEVEDNASAGIDGIIAYKVSSIVPNLGQLSTGNLTATIDGNAITLSSIDTDEATTGLNLAVFIDASETYCIYLISVATAGFDFEGITFAEAGLYVVDPVGNVTGQNVDLELKVDLELEEASAEMVVYDASEDVFYGTIQGLLRYGLDSGVSCAAPEVPDNFVPDDGDVVFYLDYIYVYNAVVWIDGDGNIDLISFDRLEQDSAVKFVLLALPTEYPLDLEDGWSVMAINKEKSYYEEIESCLFGREIVQLIGTFKDCSNLIYAPTIPATVTDLWMTFQGCNNLISVVIPDNIMSIGGSVFAKCCNLRSVEIPSSVSFVGNAVFYGCISLTSVTFSEDSSIVNLGIDSNVLITFCGVFEECNSLITFAIPDGITSIVVNTFKDCTGLVSIIIPDGVTSIGNYAFQGCGSLSSIQFAGTVAQWNAIDKGDYWNEGVPATEVVCSDGTVTL